MRNTNRIDNIKTARLLANAVRANGVQQGVLSNKTGLNQSQISRLLSGKFQRRSKGLNALCAFLKVKPVLNNSAISLSGYPDLAICLDEILDGSRNRERAVVRLLKSARRLA
jgi:DNA-binding Xre family transcriptional regulator